MNSKLQEACNGKSDSQGGLNLKDFRDMLSKLMPEREAEIRGTKRAELEKICKEPKPVSPKKSPTPTPSPVKPLIGFRKIATRVAHPAGGLELPLPVLEALHHHWVPELSEKGQQVLDDISPSLGDISLENLPLFGDEGEVHYKIFEEYPKFTELPKKRQDKMLNTVLTSAPQIRLELPSAGFLGIDIIPLIASNTNRGITVGDFLNTFFKHNQKVMDSPDHDPNYGFGGHVYWEGLTKATEYIKGKGWVPTKDNVFLVNFGSYSS